MGIMLDAGVDGVPAAITRCMEKLRRAACKPVDVVTLNDHTKRITGLEPHAGRPNFNLHRVDRSGVERRNALVPSPGLEDR